MADPVVDNSLLGGAAPGAAKPGDAPAAKPADQGGAAPAPKDGEAKPAEQGKETPPAEVKYELKVPDGVDLKDSLPKFVEVAKELQLTPEHAQKLVDWYVKQGSEKSQAVNDAWKQTNDGWIAEAKADKEIGGEAFDKTIASAKQAMAKFGGEKFTEALNMTGMGNHPEMIRFLAKVAKGFAEDNLQGGTPQGDKPKSAADILFPK